MKTVPGLIFKSSQYDRRLSKSAKNQQFQSESSQYHVAASCRIGKKIFREDFRERASEAIGSKEKKNLIQCMLVGCYCASCFDSKTTLSVQVIQWYSLVSFY